MCSRIRTSSSPSRACSPDPIRSPTRCCRPATLYEGVPVTSVVTCAEALNNRGQIVMTVQSENPDTFEVRTFIVRATPRGVRDDD